MDYMKTKSFGTLCMFFKSALLASVFKIPVPNDFVAELTVKWILLYQAFIKRAP